MAIPAGVIIGWPSTAGTIPAGWTRVTSLDGRYLKGVPNNFTNPGTTGGASTHSHTTTSHTHSLNHSHTTPAETLAGSTDKLIQLGTFEVASHDAHEHSLPDTSSTTVNSASSSPSTATAVNDPVNALEIWIQSDGSPERIPANATVFYNGTTVPAGFTAGSADSFLKGAAAAGDGGANSAGSTSHSHTVNSHTHSGTSHTHTIADTGAANQSVLSFTAGGGPGIEMPDIGHTHSVAVNSNSAASLNSAAGGTSGASSAALPPYYKLSIIRNGGAPQPVPSRTVAAWLGGLSSIPSGWRLCDGTNGTPNLLGKYIRGAVTTGEHGTTGGSTGSHAHTAPTHTHSTSSHNHTTNIAAADFTLPTDNSPPEVYAADQYHLHAASTDSTTPAVGSAAAGSVSSTTTEPPYTTVAFIQYHGPGSGLIALFF